MICIGRHVGGHTLALQHGDQNGACNLQVAGRRLQVAGQNLKYARTVNAKVILGIRKKLSLQRHANRKYLVPGNCFLGVRICIGIPVDQNFSASHF